MFELFYNLFGLNVKLFTIINDITNTGPLPIIFQFISALFFFTNFALIYCGCGLYCFYKLKTIPVTSDKIIYFNYIYYKLVKIGLYYSIFVTLFTLLKFSINLPRPFCSLSSEVFTTVINTDYARCLSTFPSAHIGLSILVGYIIWPYLNYLSKIFYGFLVNLLALGRIALAMHYPADLIYGVIFAILTIKIGNYLFNLLKKNLFELIKKKLLNYL